MTSPQPTPELNAEERAFVTRVAEHYRPPPMTGARRAAFDEALERRLRRPPRPGWRQAALAAAAAAVLAWLTLPWPARQAVSPPVAGSGGGGPQVVAADRQAELREVLAADDWFTTNGEAATLEGDLLPDDYLVLSQLFVDG